MHKQLPDLYAALPRAQELRPKGRALYSGASLRPCGRRAAGADHVETDHDSVRIGEAWARLDAVLERAAILLRDANCLRGWRDELLDVVAGEDSWA